MPQQRPERPQDGSQDTTDQQYASEIPYNQQTGQTEADLRQGERRAEGQGEQRAEQRAEQGAERQPMRQQADEDDPMATGAIPQPTTGERRWVSSDLGALDSEGGHDWTNQVGTVTGPGTPGLAGPAGGASDQGEWPPIGGDQNKYWNPEEYAIQGDMMAGGPTIQGAPFAEGMPPEPQGKPTEPAGNDGFLEQGIEGPPNEAYGQGVTRQFAPRGAEPGIEQQEVLQSQQYEREERHSEQGMLGVVGDMLGKLFGNAKRTPDEDEGEAAGEAHP